MFMIYLFLILLYVTWRWLKAYAISYGFETFLAQAVRRDLSPDLNWLKMYAYMISDSLLVSIFWQQHPLAYNRSRRLFVRLIIAGLYSLECVSEITTLFVIYTNLIK